MGLCISEPSSKGEKQDAPQIINSHYMIITSEVGIGREQIKLEEQYLIRDGEQIRIADQDQQQRQLTGIQVDYDGLRMWRFFNQKMNYFCKINTKAYEDEITREFILEQIKEMFSMQRIGSLIYVSGCSGQKQTQLFFQGQGLDILISLREIIELWRQRNQMQSSLLLILDFNYSGAFIEELLQIQQNVKYFYSKSISIIASCKSDQKNLWTQQGSLFSLNFLKTFYQLFRCDTKASSIYAPEQFEPISFCNLYHLNKIFGIQMQNFQSWEELESFQKYKQEFAQDKDFGWQVQSTQENHIMKEQYQGQWANELYHGRGVIFYDNGDVYEGNFFNGSQLGRGVYYYGNGDKFEGMFSDNKKNGFGRETFKDGSYEEGEYVEGIIQGDGKQVFVNGDIFEGNYENGRWNGRGRYYYANKEKFEGNFLNNLKHGVGTYYYSNGILFRGIYEQDLKNGPGFTVMPNGQQIQQEYYMDIQKSSSPLKQEQNGELDESQNKTGLIPKGMMQPSMKLGFLNQYDHQREESNSNLDQPKEIQANSDNSGIQEKESKLFQEQPEEPELAVN